MSATQEQIDMLLDFVQENQGFAKGVKKNVEGRVKTNQLWINITSKLNNVGGAVKTVKQWQKVWADRKYLAKKAAAAYRRSAATGSPTTPPPLSEAERRVIEILGEDLCTRQTQASSPAYKQNLRDDQNTDQSSSEESTYDKDLIIIKRDPLAAERKGENVSKTSDQPAFRNQRKRRILSQSQRSDSDVELQLVHLEERKIEELTGIRQELRELTGAVRQLLEVIQNKN
ncbi:unnamed protein product, partial [Iphiclides podalirius]